MMVIKKWESNYVLDNNCGIPFISYFVYCKHILFSNILWTILGEIVENTVASFSSIKYSNTNSTNDSMYCDTIFNQFII